MAQALNMNMNLNLNLNLNLQNINGNGGGNNQLNGAEEQEPTTPHNQPIVMPPGILNAPRKADGRAVLHDIDNDNTW